MDVHLILDNYATHKHANVGRWLATHPRFHRHFTPTSSSWLNLVERWFRDLTDKALRRGVFHSVPDLIAAIEAYLPHAGCDVVQRERAADRPGQLEPASADELHEVVEVAFLVAEVAEHRLRSHTQHDAGPELQRVHR